MTCRCNGGVCSLEEQLATARDALRDREAELAEALRIEVSPERLRAMTSNIEYITGLIAKLEAKKATELKGV